MLTKSSTLYRLVDVSIARTCSCCCTPKETRLRTAGKMLWYSKLEGSPGLVQIKECGQELLELVLVSGRIGRKEVSNGNGRGKGGIGREAHR
jgi:hypothetical protein